MHAMGWNVIKVPKSAPTRETKLLNTGIPLAIIYAMIVTPDTHVSQVIQWRGVFAVKWLVPWSRRTKIYLLVTYKENVSYISEVA